MAGASDHGNRSREIKSAEEIVGNALSELGQHVRGGRSHQQTINGLRDGYMLDCGVEIGLLGRGAEHAGDDLLAGKRGKGERADKLLRRSGHDDLHTYGAVLQQANEFGGLVGCDSAADTECNSHPCP